MPFAKCWSNTGHAGVSRSSGHSLCPRVNHNRDHCYTVQGVMKSSLRRSAWEGRVSWVPGDHQELAGKEKEKEQSPEGTRLSRKLESKQESGMIQISEERFWRMLLQAHFGDVCLHFFTTPKLCYKNDWECYVKKYTHMIIIFYIHMKVYPIYWRWKLFHFQQKL